MAPRTFKYQDPFPLGKDETTYRKIEGSEKYIEVEQVCRQGRGPGLSRGADRSWPTRRCGMSPSCSVPPTTSRSPRSSAIRKLP